MLIICPDWPIMWLGTRAPLRKPLAEGVRMGGPWPGIAWECPGLGDIETFIILTSPELVSELLCCKGDGIADH